jgi:hypothetical protein
MVRNNIPILSILAVVFVGIKALLQKLTNVRRIPFLFAASLIFVLGLHGTNALKVIAILSINYTIAISLGSSRLNPLLTWIFNMGALFAIERNNGFPFANISPSLAVLVEIPHSSGDSC